MCGLRNVLLVLVALIGVYSIAHAQPKNLIPPTSPFAKQPDVLKGTGGNKLKDPKLRTLARDALKRSVPPVKDARYINCNWLNIIVLRRPAWERAYRDLGVGSGEIQRRARALERLANRYCAGDTEIAHAEARNLHGLDEGLDQRLARDLDISLVDAELIRLAALHARMREFQQFCFGQGAAAGAAREGADALPPIFGGEWNLLTARFPFSPNIGSNEPVTAPSVALGTCQGGQIPAISGGGDGALLHPRPAPFRRVSQCINDAAARAAEDCVDPLGDPQQGGGSGGSAGVAGSLADPAAVGPAGVAVLAVAAPVGGGSGE